MDIQKENVGFGDFCSIEQKRYGAQNEFYGYKVVNRLRSNSWICVPVDARDQKPKLHDEVFDVVEVISLTAGCNVIERFRVIDLARAWTTKAQVPEGFVLMPIKPTETMVMAVVKEHEGDAFLPYSLYDAYVKQAMIEAQGQGQ